MSALTVSIVIPNWNGWLHLRQRLRSLQLLDDTAASLETVVIDNGSTDGSPNHIRSRFPHVQLIRNDSNRGFCTANNQAARLSTGLYVAFPSNDAAVAPGWLQFACRRARRPAHLST
jgi:GT2 family glycosyltransferase